MPSARRASAPRSIWRANFSRKLPDIPTMHESGYPNFEAAAWYGLLVPARTPQAIVNKLHKDWSSAIMLPDVRKPLVNDIIDPTPSDSPKAFAQFLA
ncbi:MAG: hypothetical protein FJY56_13950, partial [Betaproteobacteria bacterium]|nr:hypothetical protein [Betaproteobacteria bacterium]